MEVLTRRLLGFPRPSRPAEALSVLQGPRVVAARRPRMRFGVTAGARRRARASRSRRRRLVRPGGRGRRRGGRGAAHGPAAGGPPPAAARAPGRCRCRGRCLDPGRGHGRCPGCGRCRCPGPAPRPTAAALTLCRTLALALLLRTPGAVVRRLGADGLRRQRRDALRQFGHRHLHARHLLDVAQVFPLLAVAERDRDPGRARPGGAADAVDVGFGDVRQIVVDDVRDAVDVDAARRDVGRDEHPAMPRLEAGKRPLALRLALVAVDRRRRDAARRKRAHDLVGAVLGAGEDEDALDRRIAQHGVEERRLLRPSART